MNSMRQNRKPNGRQSGMSLLEVMVALSVLLIGVLGSLVFMTMAIGSNFKNRQGSNATAISQMMVEKIMSVGANTNPTLTINDCAGNPHTINTLAGGANPFDANGNILFNSAPGTAGDPVGYNMLFTDCGTGGRQIVYDVRWNIQAPTLDTKLVTVSTRMTNLVNDQKMFSPAVTVRCLLGPSGVGD